jgi:hypothetical protein
MFFISSRNEAWLPSSGKRATFWPEISGVGVGVGTGDLAGAASGVGLASSAIPIRARTAGASQIARRLLPELGDDWPGPADSGEDSRATAGF